MIINPEATMNQQEALDAVGRVQTLDERATEVCELLGIKPNSISYSLNSAGNSFTVTWDLWDYYDNYHMGSETKTMPLNYLWMENSEIVREEEAIAIRVKRQKELDQAIVDVRKAEYELKRLRADISTGNDRLEVAERKYVGLLFKYDALRDSL